MSFGFEDMALCSFGLAARLGEMPVTHEPPLEGGLTYECRRGPGALEIQHSLFHPEVFTGAGLVEFQVNRPESNNDPFVLRLKILGAFRLDEDRFLLMASLPPCAYERKDLTKEQRFFFSGNYDARRRRGPLKLNPWFVQFVQSGKDSSYLQYRGRF